MGEVQRKGVEELGYEGNELVEEVWEKGRDGIKKDGRQSVNARSVIEQEP